MLHNLIHPGFASIKRTAVTHFVLLGNAELTRMLSCVTGGTAKPVTDVRFVLPADQVGPPRQHACSKPSE